MGGAATVGDPDGHAQLAATAGYANHKAQHPEPAEQDRGQIRGISAMVTDDRYRIDVLTQVSAATHALQAATANLLDDHIRSCVLNATSADAGRRAEMIDELAPDRPGCTSSVTRKR